MIFLASVLLCFAGSCRLVLTEAQQENSGAKNSFQEEIEEKAGKENFCSAENGTIAFGSDCSKYYRCEREKAVLVTCEDGLLFDKSQEKCVPISQSECNDIPSDVCQEQSDGFYPDLDLECHHYFRCEGGKTNDKMTCPDGQAFSFSEQMCLPSKAVSCVVPSCDPLTSDFFWLPGTLCHSYYSCHQGTARLFNCPHGQQFNRNTKHCVKNGECYEPICLGKPDGNHSDTSHECSRFLQCRGGSLEGVTSCPSGLVHDGHSCKAEARCESPQSTAVLAEDVYDDCRGYADGMHVIPATECQRYQLCRDGTTVARFSCPVGTKFNGDVCTPHSFACFDLCAEESDGYHADHTQGCRKYHLCQQGRTIERHSCPDGSLYSGGMCLPKFLVSCSPTDTGIYNKNPCLGLSDGFHADYLYKCSNYFYCSGYRTILRSSCPTYSVWNGKQCVAPQNALCSDAEPSTQCHGRPTGLYPDESRCNYYIYCYHGNKTLLSCPQGEVFDGKTCRSEKNYECPNRGPTSCYKKEDGYHLDEESSCRAYFYCSNGQKTTYVCPFGFIFNGTTCVSPEKFSCPFRNNVCSNKSDGYHPDYSSSCKKYFFCQDGTKLNTLSCGSYKVFDGSRCVYNTDMVSTCREI